MPLGGSEIDLELLRTINTIVENQVRDNKRIERLETLEFHKARDGLGCITWIDYDHGTKAVHRVDTPGADCNGNYCWTTLTIWWSLFAVTSGVHPLYMQIDALVDATYYYAYSYTQAGATFDWGQGADTKWLIGNIGGGVMASGRVDFAIWADEANPTFISEWELYDSTEDPNDRVQRGNSGGNYLDDTLIPERFDIYSDVNITGDVYLYGWCPEMTPGGIPPD